MVSERSGNEGSPSWIVLTDARAITLCLICHLLSPLLGSRCATFDPQLAYWICYCLYEAVVTVSH